MKVFKIKKITFSFIIAIFIIIKTPMYKIKTYRLQKPWVRKKSRHGLERNSATAGHTMGFIQKET